MAVITKATELRQLGDEELVAQLREAKEELFNLRFQAATGQLENTNRLKVARKENARILTLMRERELGIETQSTPDVSTPRSPRPVRRGRRQSNSRRHPDSEVNPRRAQYKLDAALLARLESSRGNRSYLEMDVTDLLRQAVSANPQGHPLLDAYLGRLVDATQAQLEMRGKGAGQEQLVEALHDIAFMESAPAMWRICAARSWGRHAARNNDWPQAAECFALAVSILPLITPHYLQRGGQDQGLSQLTGLASDAAASALNAGDIDRAVQLLEQARSWLLAQALESHSDFTELHKRAPKLADRLTRLREKLDAPQAGHAGNETALAGQLSHLDPKASRRMMEARTEVATSWNQLITRIRNTLPEFKNFLHPPILPELLESASSGPLVLINISDYRSDAFILTSQEVDTVPLPGLTPERIGEETSRFLDALQIIHDPKCTHAQMVRAQGEIHPILEWLWDTATGPILDRLDLTSTPGADQEWPRIWWSPSGLLTYLPPHAAGYHQDDRYPARTVLDRVVSSYTPTVRALQYARNHQQAPLDGAQILVVAMPQTAGAPDLPGARAEADLVRGMFSALELSGPQATHDSVRDSLGSHFFAHFACHGLSDCNDPSHSHLLLHDHQSNPLTVLDISRLRLPDSRLAYLSACDTARTVVDEVDHITAAFQLAGYTHVIGALWPINDITSVEIAKTVYQKLSRKSSEALAVEETAAALHSAIRSVRNRYPKAPSLWAAHIHAGP